jgi:hypothetical protein
MGSEQRRSPRVKCYAKVLFARTTPGYIRDLSRTGCHLSFVQSIPAAPGDDIARDVVAGGGTQTVPFSFRLRVRWVKSDGIYFSLGGEIIEPPAEGGEDPFAKLVEYYQGEGA